MLVAPTTRSWLPLAFSSFALVMLLASVLQAQTAVRIVALGASNTEGWGVLPAQSYPAQLQVLLRARGIEATVANAGIAGDTTGGMLARLDRAVPAGTDLVILQPGTNDERMGLTAERSANIEKIATLSLHAISNFWSSRTPFWMHCHEPSCATTGSTSHLPDTPFWPSASSLR